MPELPAPLAAALDRLVQFSVRPVVLIDGGAGAGKTTLANRILDAWPAPTGVQLVSLDDLYPGWDGLAAGSRCVPDVIRGDGYRRWDWQNARPDGWRPLDRGGALIVEGCGALTPASRALADLAIWLELDESTRKARALARDGVVFAPHWDEWATQEAAHWGTDHPRELADLVIEG